MSPGGVVELTSSQLPQFTTMEGGQDASVTLVDGYSTVENSTGVFRFGQLSLAAAPDSLILNGSIQIASINSGGGNDFIQINDTVAGDSSVERALHGGDGSDTLGSTSGLNVITGDVGKDLIQGGSDSDTLYGGVDDDTLNGGGGDDILNGGTGQDILTGGPGADAFVFDAKDSTIAAPDTITDFNQAQHDQIDLTQIDADTTRAGHQSFSLGGSAFTHTAGELIQYSDGAGHTILAGDVDGDGNADFSISFDGAITLNASDFVDSLAGSLGDDSIQGTDHGDFIKAGGGNDTVAAAGGDDTVLSGPGDDSIDGGSGNDSLGNSTGADTIQGGTGDDHIDDQGGPSSVDGAAVTTP